MISIMNTQEIQHIMYIINLNNTFVDKKAQCVISKVTLLNMFTLYIALAKV